MSVCKARYANWSTTDTVYTKHIPDRHWIIYKMQQKKKKKTYKTIFGPIKAYLVLRAGDGRFGCSAYILNLSHVMHSLDNFCVKALKMKGTRWTLVTWTINIHLFSLHFLFLLPAVVQAREGRMSNFVFPFISAFPVSGLGGDEELCMAVDGDAWQVVPDDLINCEDKEGKDGQTPQGAEPPCRLNACATGCHMKNQQLASC